MTSSRMLRFFVGTDEPAVYGVISEDGKVKVFKLGKDAVSHFGKHLVILSADHMVLLYGEREDVRLRLSYEGLFVKRDTAKRCTRREIKQHEKERSTNVVLKRVPNTGGVLIFK